MSRYAKYNKLRFNKVTEIIQLMLYSEKPNMTFCHCMLEVQRMGNIGTVSS